MNKTDLVTVRITFDKGHSIKTMTKAEKKALIKLIQLAKKYLL